MSFSQKYLSEVAKQLDELSVSKNKHLYGENLEEDSSDDDEFLTRIGIGSLNNEGVEKYLSNIKEEIEAI